MRAAGGGARTERRAREGFAAVSLPPRLDPVVKAPGEAGPGPPRSLREEAGAGKEGSGGPAWAGRREELGSLGGPVFSFPVSWAARLQDAPTRSYPNTDKAGIRGPDANLVAHLQRRQSSGAPSRHEEAGVRGPSVELQRAWQPEPVKRERLHGWLAPLFYSLTFLAKFSEVPLR